MKAAISEIVGRAADTQGKEISIYIALRQLLCARCDAAIKEGEFFTRKKLAGVKISPYCRECAPFELHPSGQSRSQLLKSLLSPEAPIKSPEKAQPDRKVVARVVERRLGPTLARCRKRRR